MVSGGRCEVVSFSVVLFIFFIGGAFCAVVCLTGSGVDHFLLADQTKIPRRHYGLIWEINY